MKGLYIFADFHDLLHSSGGGGIVVGCSEWFHEIMKIGERRVNLMRMFNIREGFTSQDDKLPAKCSVPLVGGLSEGKNVPEKEISAAILDYYCLMGWDEKTGIPTKGKLADLGLSWANL